MTRPDDQLMIISKRACREVAKMQIALEGIAAAAGTGVIANLARAGLDLPHVSEVWSRILAHLKHLDRHLAKIESIDPAGDMIARHCVEIAARGRLHIDG